MTGHNLYTPHPFFLSLPFSSSRDTWETRYKVDRIDSKTAAIPRQRNLENRDSRLRASDAQIVLLTIHCGSSATEAPFHVNALLQLTQLFHTLAPFSPILPLAVRHWLL
uniref:Uncharacterized protein LOC108039169 n=1 Tax=Drosophila rhopaloa TaxID=1041015 RepID=A0A6P4EE48_DRORH